MAYLLLTAAIVVVALLITLACARAVQQPAGRERYGPPPGVRRAVGHDELTDSRGWAGYDRVYEGSSASALTHMVERSA